LRSGLGHLQIADLTHLQLLVSICQKAIWRTLAPIEITLVTNLCTVPNKKRPRGRHDGLTPAGGRLKNSFDSALVAGWHQGVHKSSPLKVLMGHLQTLLAR
jgi:hypothetical protein